MIVNTGMPGAAIDAASRHGAAKGCDEARVREIVLYQRHLRARLLQPRLHLDEVGGRNTLLVVHLLQPLELIFGLMGLGARHHQLQVILGCIELRERLTRLDDLALLRPDTNHASGHLESQVARSAGLDVAA
jgi:hypothetical protein